MTQFVGVFGQNWTNLGGTAVCPKISIDKAGRTSYYFIMVTTLEIPQEILESARLTTSELKVEIAVSLYASGRLSVGKARELASMSLWQFRQLLASRQVSPHFDLDDLAEDVAALKKLENM